MEHETVSTESFKQLKRRLRLTNKKYAEALGIGERSVDNYNAGRRIPKSVGLAMSALAMNLPVYGATIESQGDDLVALSFGDDRKARNTALEND